MFDLGLDQSGDASYRKRKKVWDRVVRRYRELSTECYIKEDLLDVEIVFNKFMENNRAVQMKPDKTEGSFRLFCERNGIQCDSVIVIGAQPNHITGKVASRTSLWFSSKSAAYRLGAWGDTAKRFAIQDQLPDCVDSHTLGIFSHDEMRVASIKANPPYNDVESFFVWRWCFRMKELLALPEDKDVEATYQRLADGLLYYLHRMWQLTSRRNIRRSLGQAVCRFAEGQHSQAIDAIRKYGSEHCSSMQASRIFE